MRIISGKNKGRRIIAPKNLPVRPTTDRAKEGLFNILNNSYFFEELSVLDLFAGTGNISYEFASRGASYIVAVDSNLGCIRFINRCNESLQSNIHTEKKDVFVYLKKSKQRFDIIFADPPYNLLPDDFYNMPKLVFEKKLLKEDGLLIIEHASKTDLSHLANFQYQRKYGDSVFSFFG